MPEVSQITHEDHHRALVRRLATEVTPTRRLWSVGVRLAQLPQFEFQKKIFQ
jgi:hypothetical protein